MKKLGLSILSTAISLSLMAQKNRQELFIGDRCPDLTFTGVLNHPTGTLKLSDYKDKLIILDFVGTNCASCIAAFPHLQDLQRQFEGKLQIIVVNQNNKQGWKKLTERNKTAKALTLPVILSDTILSSFFPHQFLPHEVWLTGNRTVKAITTSQYVTAGNIRQVLAGKKITWPAKKDLGYYSFENPIPVIKEPDNFRSPFFYSVLTGYRQGTLSGRKMVTDSMAGIKRFTIVNAALPILFKATLSDTAQLKLANNRFLLEVKDPSRFFYDSTKAYKDQWEAANTYCYETVVPLRTAAEELQQQLRKDLGRFLNLYGHEEKRTVPCYVLLKDSLCSDAVLTGESPKPRFKTTSSLVSTLNLVYSLPVLDETGIVHDINMSEPGEAIFDLKSLEQYLNRYGLKCIKAEREINVFVVTEK